MIKHEVPQTHTWFDQISDQKHNVGWFLLRWFVVLERILPPSPHKLPPRNIATLNIPPGLGLGFGVGLRLGPAAIFSGTIFQGAVFLVPFLRHY